MNRLSIFFLKALKKFYSKVNNQPRYKVSAESDPDISSKIIIDWLTSDKPCMIARFGSVELHLLSNYIGIKNHKDKSALKYIQGKCPAWWWEQIKIEELQNNAGFFPNDLQKIIQFCNLMLEDISEVNVLGSWRPEEDYFKKELLNTQQIVLELMNPYFSKVPWTMALENKKVLVVHPFAATIKKQYLRRELLFKNNLLPYFELKTLKAVQSIAGNKTDFKSWFDALDYMKSEIDKVDYDICLIGAGAYGFPLAAHVKRSGKKAVHLGGSLQLLFGIKGARWENPNYHPVYNYSSLMNEYWVRPEKDEKPSNAESIEGGCYW